MTYEDIIKISKYFKVSEIDFLSKYCKAQKFTKGKYKFNIYELSITNGSCVFIGMDNLCQINEVKPFQCLMSPEFLNRTFMAEMFECMSGLAGDENPVIEEKFLDGLQRVEHFMVGSPSATLVAKLHDRKIEQDAEIEVVNVDVRISQRSSKPPATPESHPAHRPVRAPRS